MPKRPIKSPAARLARRLPFFYGWLMIPFAILANAATSPGQTFLVSVFNPSLVEALDIRVSQLTFAYMIGTLVASVPQPYIGGIFDRFGAKKTIIGIVFLLGMACFFTAQVSSLLMLFLAFFFLRLLGQGALSIVAGNIPALWFREKLGLVSGIVNVGMAASIAVIPPVVLKLINAVGWRSSYRILGLTVWAVILPLSALFLQDRPEDVAQTLDGVPLDIPSPNANPELHSLRNKTYTLKEARRTPAYWIVLVNSALWALIVSGVLFNIIPIFTTQGLNEGQAAATYTTLAAASVASQLIGGPLADRTPLKWFLMLGTFSLSVAVFLLTTATNALLGQLYGVFLGISQGLFNLVGSTLWAKYFGRAHLGKIRGSVFTAIVAGSSVGPFTVGLLFDQFGSYQLSLWIFIAFLIPTTLSCIWANNPQGQTAP